MQVSEENQPIARRPHVSNGRIHVNLNPELVRVILELLDAIEQQLPFLQTLPPSEKKRLVKARAGAQEVLEGIADLQRAAGMPPGEDDPMLADLSVHRGLTQIGDRVSALAQRIDDTRFLAGSEGWTQGLVRYGMLRQLERTNPTLKTRLDRLQRLIAKNSGRTTPVEDEPETPEPTDPAE
jgi:hypothetical protein